MSFFDCVSARFLTRKLGRKYERVNLDFMIQSRYAGDEARIDFLRDGQAMRYDFVLCCLLSFRSVCAEKE